MEPSYSAEEILGILDTLTTVAQGIIDLDGGEEDNWKLHNVSIVARCGSHQCGQRTHKVTLATRHHDDVLEFNSYDNTVLDVLQGLCEFTFKHIVVGAS